MSVHVLLLVGKMLWASFLQALHFPGLVPPNSVTYHLGLVQWVIYCQSNKGLFQSTLKV
jgi:hypothetical protein